MRARTAQNPWRRPAGLLAAGLLAACHTPPPSGPAPGSRTGAPPPTGAVVPADGPRPTLPTPGAIPAPAPTAVGERRVLQIEGGKERWLSATEAAAGGYTVVDLSDDWTPHIFLEHPGPDGLPLPNRYRRVFVGLANDKLDEDGQPLPPGAKNHLELLGIPPSLSVLRTRFLHEAARSCDPPTRANPPARTTKSGDAAVLADAERRLACEGFLLPALKHRAGKLDDGLRRAIKAFQQKHMIYEGHGLAPRTREALSRPVIENDHRALLRVLRERVVSGAAVIEDGTGQKSLRNLADEYTDVAARQLGLDTPDGALAFFRRRSAEDFARLSAAVKLPAPPEYYGPDMDLQIVVDRGDVWYDLPFDAAGKYAPHARKKFPQFMVFVRHNGARLLLARWRTTIGGWRAEQAGDGYEYFRYKGSDVGPRVIRQVIAGPVWIAPAATPIRSLVKGAAVRGRRELVVNYSELGPGYLSAYGLVAGYFVTPGKDGRPDWDNGIRAHGSAEYLSMYSANGFSHGCHRLPNHLALRLYSFLLRHRPSRVVGDLGSDFARQFLRGDDVFEIRIASRGYAFQLDPPVPVDVLEGEIKGEVKKPMTGYVPKPGTVYPGPPPPAPDSPEARAGGGAATPGRKPADDDDGPAEPETPK